MAQLDLKARRLETSVGVVALPAEAVRDVLADLEARCRAWKDGGATRPIEATDELGLIGFDWIPDRRFARPDGAFPDCDLSVRVRAAPGLGPPDAAKRLAEVTDGLLFVADGASRAEATALVDRAALPTAAWSDGDDVDVGAAIEGVVARTLGPSTAPAGPSAPRSHPLLDALRSLVVDVADAHFARVESALDARAAAEAKRIAEADKRLARVAAELAGRATSDAKSRADDAARVVKLAETLDDVRRGLSALGPNVGELTTGVTEITAALDTIGGVLESILHAVEASAVRGEARARRLDGVAALLGVQDERLRSVESAQLVLTRTVTERADDGSRETLAEEIRAARAELAEVAARTAALGVATSERLDRVEEGLNRLRRERVARDPVTAELHREVAELCEELKKRKKGWFG